MCDFVAISALSCSNVSNVTYAEPEPAPVAAAPVAAAPVVVKKVGKEKSLGCCSMLSVTEQCFFC